MFAYLITVKNSMHEALKVKGRKQESAFNKVVKKGLQATALFWHKEYIAGHFTREAYQKYGADYPPPKQYERKPFVYSGSLRDRMCSRKGPSHLSGTPSRITLKMQIGRPKGKGVKNINAKIAILMKSVYSKQEAQKLAYKGQGYSEKVKDMFQKGIASVAPEEQERMVQFLAQFIVDELNQGGPVESERL